MGWQTQFCHKGESNGGNAPPHHTPITLYNYTGISITCADSSMQHAACSLQWLHPLTLILQLPVSWCNPAAAAVLQCQKSSVLHRINVMQLLALHLPPRNQTIGQRLGTTWTNSNHLIPHIIVGLRIELEMKVHPKVRNHYWGLLRYCAIFANLRLIFAFQAVLKIE